MPPSEKSRPKAPVQLPKKEAPGDGFPAEKDVSTPPPGTDQSKAAQPAGRPRKRD